MSEEGSRNNEPSKCITGNDWFDDGGITIQNSGNTYKIVGDIVVDKPDVSYHITVTGGVFGEIPQMCEK